MNDDPNHEIMRATAAALEQQGSRVLAEAVRGHRAAGATTAFELVNSSGVPMIGVVVAALNACANLSEALAEEREQDVDDMLNEWVDAARVHERDALAHLAELTSGGGGA